MQQFFNNLDRKLRLYNPVLWGLKIHYVIPAILLGFIISFLFGFVQSPSIYQDYDPGLAIFIAYVFVVAGAVFWLVHVFRFNKWKSFGSVKRWEGLGHFIIVWILFFLMAFIPLGMELGRFARTNLDFEKEEIVNDINTYNLNYWALSMDDYDYHLGDFYVKRTDTNEWDNVMRGLIDESVTRKDLEPGTYIISDDSIIVTKDGLTKYTFGEFDKVKFRGYSISLPKNLKDKILSGRQIYNMLKAQGRPWFKNTGKFDAAGLNKPAALVTEMLAINKKYYNYSKLSKNSLESWIRFYQNFDYDYTYNNDYEYAETAIANDADDSELRDLKNIMGFETLSKAAQSYHASINTEINDLSDHIDEVSYYSFYNSSSNFSTAIKVIFYVAMALALLYFIFRHVTLKTFGVSVGVSFMLSALFGILMGLSAWINGNIDYAPWVLYYIYFGVFILFALQIFKAKKRSIFHGMGLIYASIFLPTLGIFTSLLIREVLCESYPISPCPYETDHFILIGEAAGLVVFIVSIEFIHRLFLRWYSLPEE
jgi:hypothetical protein